jgi:hypothetical protein
MSTSYIYSPPWRLYGIRGITLLFYLYQIINLEGSIGDSFNAGIAFL